MAVRIGIWAWMGIWNASADWDDVRVTFVKWMWLIWVSNGCDDGEG